jgi:hypothetical protein
MLAHILGGRTACLYIKLTQQKSCTTEEQKLHTDMVQEEQIIDASQLPPPPPGIHDDSLPHMSPSEIAQCAKAVRKESILLLESSYSVESRKRMLSELFSNFAAQYPVLFEKCCDPTFPLELLGMCISQLQLLASDNASHKDATDAVLNDLNAVYVDPVLAGLESSRQKKQA